MIFIKHIYKLYRAYIQVEECQIWDKIKEIGQSQVRRALFGLILHQNRSHRVYIGCLWDASRTPKPT